MKSIEEQEYNLIMRKAKRHLDSLEPIAKTTKETPEGGIYYEDNTYNTNPALIPKQKNIITLSKNASRILEVGFNMGHSALFMLLSNPNSRIHCIDICSHSYTKHCFSYLNKMFPNRLTLYEGESHEGLCAYNPEEQDKPDLCHIDGCHDTRIANIDYFLCKSKCKDTSVIVFDDTWLENLNNLWEGYIRDGHLTEFVINPTPEKGHRYGRIRSHPKLVDMFVKNSSLVKPENKKICVCTLTIGDLYKTTVEQATITKINYCEMYGYSYRNDEDVYDNTRPPAWSKIKLLQKCLEEKDEKGSPLYDYLVWIDADALIMNPNKKLEDFISNHSENKDILLAQDWNRLNTGVMFIKNTPWVLEFLKEVYSRKEHTYDPDWDQKSFIVCHEENALQCHDHIKVMPIYKQREFNSYYCMYKDGDFIIHIAGCFRDGIDKGLKEMVERVAPHMMSSDTENTYAQRLHWLKNVLNC